jgi:hypothetical protein
MATGRAGWLCGRIACVGVGHPSKMTLAVGKGEHAVKIKVIVHEAEEGGYWAEVPAIPGCATEGETFEALLQNLYEAIEGCTSPDA